MPVKPIFINITLSFIFTFIFNIHYYIYTIMSGMSEIFWSFLITSLIAFFTVIVRMCYKSKCENIQCGLTGITIKRNVVLEEKTDEIELQQKNIIKTESKDNI